MTRPPRGASHPQSHRKRAELLNANNLLNVMFTEEELHSRGADRVRALSRI
jgi:hypothetical protein